MHPRSLRAFLLLTILCTANICSGYKPFKGNVADKNQDRQLQDDPKSIYNSEVFNQYRGIHIEDNAQKENVGVKKNEHGGQLHIYSSRWAVPYGPRPKESTPQLVDRERQEKKYSIDTEEYDENEECKVGEIFQTNPKKNTETNKEHQKEHIQILEGMRHSHEDPFLEDITVEDADSGVEMHEHGPYLGLKGVAAADENYDHEDKYIAYEDVFGQEGDEGGQGQGQAPAQEDGVQVVEVRRDGGEDIVVLDAGEGDREPVDGGSGTPALYLTSTSGEEEGEGACVGGPLTPASCRVCAPCCQLLGEHSAVERGAAQRNVLDDECSPDASESSFLSSECRTCHVRRRLPRLGVVLTCYDCAQQQADRTCRLGLDNPETSMYRVSAKFFLTSETKDTSEVTSTQHSSSVHPNVRTAAFNQYLQEYGQSSPNFRTPVQPPPSFLDTEDAELYPFQADEQKEERSAHGDGDAKHGAGGDAKVHDKEADASHKEKKAKGKDKGKDKGQGTKDVDKEKDKEKGGDDQKSKVEFKKTKVEKAV